MQTLDVGERLFQSTSYRAVIELHRGAPHSPEYARLTVAAQRMPK